MVDTPVGGEQQQGRNRAASELIRQQRRQTVGDVAGAMSHPLAEAAQQQQQQQEDWLHRPQQLQPLQTGMHQEHRPLRTMSQLPISADASDALLASPRFQRLQQQKPTVAGIVLQLQRARHLSQQPGSPRQLPPGSHQHYSLDAASGNMDNSSVQQKMQQQQLLGREASLSQQMPSRTGSSTYQPGSPAGSSGECWIMLQSGAEAGPPAGGAPGAAAPAGASKAGIQWHGVDGMQGSQNKQQQAPANDHRMVEGDDGAVDDDDDDGTDELDIDFLSSRVHPQPPAAHGFAALRLSRASSSSKPGGREGRGSRSSRMLVALGSSMARLAKAFLWDVLLPDHAVRITWDLVMLLALGYVCAMLPFTIAFNFDLADLSGVYGMLDLGINCLFLWDIWMNFHTAYLDDYGKPVLARGAIAWNYITGWFVVDAVSAIPYELMMSNNAQLMSLMRAARLVRLVKLSRLFRMLRIASAVRLSTAIRALESFAGRATLRMLAFLLGVTLLIHWAACLFHYVADTEQQDGQDNWVAHSGMEGASVMELYVTALYWSVTTMATVGYGDVVAHTMKEKGVAIVAMLIGASIFGYFMGAMASLISTLDSNSAKVAQKRQAVEDFLRHRKVPRALADKVRNYYSYVVARELQAEEANIIGGLSSSLRTQVVLHLYQEALEKVPFFRNKPTQFITSVMTYLKLEFYSPGDIVMRQGDIASEMYFIAEGTLEVRVYEDRKGRPLSATSYMPTHRKSTERRSRISVEAIRSGAQRIRRAAGARSRSSAEGAYPSMPSSASWSNLQDPGLTTLTGSSADAAVPGATGKAAKPKRLQFVDDLANKPFRSVGYLHAGEYFSEYSCLLAKPRTATVAATTYCELYCLRRADLEMVLEEWPEVAEEFKHIVSLACGITPTFGTTTQQRQQQQQQQQHRDQQHPQQWPCSVSPTPSPQPEQDGQRLPLQSSSVQQLARGRSTAGARAGDLATIPSNDGSGEPAGSTSWNTAASQANTGLPNVPLSAAGASRSPMGAPQDSSSSSSSSGGWAKHAWHRAAAGALLQPASPGTTPAGAATAAAAGTQAPPAAAANSAPATGGTAAASHDGWATGAAAAAAGQAPVSNQYTRDAVWEQGPGPTIFSPLSRHLLEGQQGRRGTLPAADQPPHHASAVLPATETGAGTAAHAAGVEAAPAAGGPEQHQQQ